MLSEAQVEKIINLVGSGTSRTEASKTVGCSYHECCRILRNNGMSEKVIPQKSIKDDIESMVASGVSCAETARQLGCTRQYVSLVCQERSIDFKPKYKGRGGKISLDYDKIKRLIESGNSIADTAKAVGCDKTSVGRIARRLGLKPVNQRKIDYEKVKSLILSGKSYHETAKIVGYSYHSVYLIARNFGLTKKRMLRTVGLTTKRIGRPVRIDYEKVKSLILSGKSYHETAKIAGCSKMSVLGFAKKTGVRSSFARGSRKTKTTIELENQPE